MLKIENLTKIFNIGETTEKTALNNVSLTLEEGDFLTIIGGNGAGKSTLLNCISGVLSVDNGTISLDGEDVTHLAEYKRAKYVSRVFQNPLDGTAGGMNIEENLALAFRRGKKRGLGWGITKEERVLFHKLLSETGLGLESLMAQKVSTLSGGQRQSLALIMAVLVQPKILLLDEHTAALDPKTAKTVLELTQKFTKDSKFITIMVTHNMNDAIKIGNKLVMMNQGNVVFQASGQEKQNLKVVDLISKFSEVGAELNDRILLNS